MRSTILLILVLSFSFSLILACSTEEEDNQDQEETMLSDLQSDENSGEVMDSEDGGWESKIGQLCTFEKIDSCPEELDCVFDHSINICGNIDWSGTCQLLPTDCSEEALEPVCTCDGDEYDNLCEMRRQGWVGPAVPCTAEDD